MIDLGVVAQRLAEDRLETEWEWLYYDQEPDSTPEPENPRPESEAPFCGCNTCVVRVVLNAAWDVLTEAPKET